MPPYVAIPGRLHMTRPTYLGVEHQPFEAGNPAADENGYVKRPNVNMLTEMMDMREAQRSYSANLAVLETTRGMLARTIEALR